jgi:hypothetical protein
MAKAGTTPFDEEPLAPPAPPVTSEEEDDDEKGRGRKMVRDAEVVLIGKIADMLGELDEPARVRVVAYLRSRYEPIAR